MPMDYHDNFQDMIARYNRELMKTYQKQRPADASEETVAVSTPPAPPPPAAPPSPAAPPCVDADTRPRYPLFSPDFAMRREQAVPPVAMWESVAVAATPEPEPEPMPEPTPEPMSEPMPEPMPESAPQPAPVPVPPDVGYLQVWVTTAGDALPVEGAHVTVSSDVQDGRSVHFIGITDRSGKTPVFPLPAANPALSMTPGGTATYTPYNIEVYADGYYRMENTGLPMYGGVNAVQTVQLIPLPEFSGAGETLTFPDSGPTGLSGEAVNG